MIFVNNNIILTIQNKKQIVFDNQQTQFVVCLVSFVVNNQLSIE